MYVSRGTQTRIIKNSLPGLSLVIDDLMRRLISSVRGAADRVCFVLFRAHQAAGFDGSPVLCSFRDETRIPSR